MSDHVNINLALPTPIVFKIGGVEYRINGDISMSQALELRRLDDALDDKQTAMYGTIDTAGSLRAEDLTPAKLKKVQSDVNDAIRAFEGAVGDLEGALRALFAEGGADVSGLKLGHVNARKIAAVAWQRAFGATDEALEAMGDNEEEGPPTPRTRRPSTGPKSSSGSAKRSAAPRANGSSSR